MTLLNGLSHIDQRAATAGRAALPTFATLEQVYCNRHACDGAAFRQAIFWHSLSRQARLVARVASICRRAIFRRDFSLIEALARTRSVEEVRNELYDFRQEPQNRSFHRRFLRLRISTGRVVAFATQYLPRRVPAARAH